MHDADNGEHSGSDATKGLGSMRLLNLVADHNGKHDFMYKTLATGKTRLNGTTSLPYPRPLSYN